MNEILRLLRLMPLVNEQISKLACEYRIQFSTMGQQVLPKLDKEVSDFLQQSLRVINELSTEVFDRSIAMQKLTSMVHQVYPQQQHSSSSADYTDAAAAQVLVEMQHGGSSPAPDSYQNSILAAFENHPRLKRQMDNHKEYQEQIMTISAVVAAKLPLVLWTVVGRGGYGILLKGLETGPRSRIFAVKMELSDDAARRSALLREWKFLKSLEGFRNDNNPSPKLVYLFPGGCRALHEYAEIKLDGKVARFLAMEFLSPFLVPLKEEAHKAFLKDGRVIPEWRTAMRDVLDSVICLHNQGIAHLDLKPEHFMKSAGDQLRIVDYGLSQSIQNKYQLSQQKLERTIFKASNPPSMTFGFGRCGNNDTLEMLGYSQGQVGTCIYRSPGFPKSQNSSVQERMPCDFWSFGIMLLELVLCLPDNVSECQSLEEALVNAVSGRSFQFFLAFLIHQHKKGSAAHIVLSNVARVDSGNLDSETGDAAYDRIMKQRRIGVSNLLKAVFILLDPETENRPSIQKILGSAFFHEYIPFADEEYELINIGMRAEHQMIDGKLQNPLVVVLIPGQGLQALNPLRADNGDPMSGYGGECGCRITRDFRISADKHSLHVLPVGNGEQIDGSPGIKFTLRSLASSGCVGSLFASSRTDPDISMQGNVGNPQTARTNKRQYENKQGQKIWASTMHAQQVIEPGSMLKWNYNWATYCGGRMFDSTEQKERTEEYSKGIPKYVKQIVQEHRRELLAQGFKDSFRVSAVPVSSGEAAQTIEGSGSCVLAGGIAVSTETSALSDAAVSGEGSDFSPTVEFDPAFDDGFGWVVLAKCLSKRNRADTLRGRVCFFLGQNLVRMELDWQIEPVLGNGSCCIAGIAGGLAQLDLETLRLQPSLQGVDWKPVEEWAAFGHRLKNQEDLECRQLRRHICLKLWGELPKCRQHMKAPLRVNKNGDINQTNFNDALRIAKELGLAEPGDDLVKRWIVALLHHKTHFTEDAVRALLAVEFKDSLAIFFAQQRRIGDQDIHFFSHVQPWIPETALYGIGLFFIPAAEIVSQQPSSSKRSRKSESAQLAPIDSVKKLDEKNRKGLKKKNDVFENDFYSTYNGNHYEGVRVSNGVGGGLIMSKLASASKCPRALSLTADDTRIKHRLSCPQRRLALAMGLHQRLGQRSVFQIGFESSLLLTILGFCEQPTLPLMIQCIHSTYKQVSGGGADGAVKGLNGSIRAKSFTKIFEYLELDKGEAIFVDFGAADGRMMSAAQAFGADKSIGYELPENIAHKMIFQAATAKLTARYPEIKWTNAEWIAQDIDEVGTDFDFHIMFLSIMNKNFL